MAIGTIDVGVTNRTVVFLSDIPEDELNAFYSFSHPKWRYIEKFRPGWNGRISYLKDGELPAGLFWATKKEVEEKLGIRFRIKSNLEWPKLKTEGVIVSDRKYQNECRDAMLRAARFGGGLVLNATRTGKTMIAGMLFSCLGGKTVFVVDQLVLLKQAKEDLESYLSEEVGWVGKSEFEPRRVTVATRQTMYLHQKKKDFKQWTKEIEVMMIDEIHEQMNKSNFSVVENIKPKAVFGLTATLQMKKKAVRVKATALTGPVVYEYPLLRGQEEGYLAKGVSVRVYYRNQFSEDDMVLRTYSKYFDRVRKVWRTRVNVRSQYKKLYDDRIVLNDERNFLIESLVRESYKRKKYIIVLVTRINHLKFISDRIKDIPHRVVSGTFEGKNVKVEDRLISRDKFEKGKVRVILANTVFKKGITIRRVDVIIDGAAGKNPDDAVQKFGRGIGLHDEKVGLIHYDISDYDEDNEKNYFMVAGDSRTKALKQSGIPVHSVIWSGETDTVRVVDKGEKWLNKQLDT